MTPALVVALVLALIAAAVLGALLVTATGRRRVAQEEADNARQRAGALERELVQYRRFRGIVDAEAVAADVRARADRDANQLLASAREQAGVAAARANAAHAQANAAATQVRTEADASARAVAAQVAALRAQAEADATAVRVQATVTAGAVRIEQAMAAKTIDTHAWQEAQLKVMKSDRPPAERIDEDALVGG